MSATLVLTPTLKSVPRSWFEVKKTNYVKNEKHVGMEKKPMKSSCWKYKGQFGPCKMYIGVG